MTDTKNYIIRTENEEKWYQDNGGREKDRLSLIESKKWVKEYRKNNK